MTAATTRGLLLAVACSLTVCCGPAGPIVTRVNARPAAPTIPIAAGAHPLGLGGPTRRWGVRDGILYIPASAASHPVPLLVLLHGGGSRANYFRFTFPLAEEFGVVILALDSRDNTWDAIDSPYGPDVVFLDQALQYTFARVAVDPRRVALGGISDGASYALSLGIANGDLFTHLVAVSPGFVAPPSPPVGRPLIFVAHGTRDNVYSVEGTRRHIVPRLKDSGYDVTYSEFDGPHSMLPPTTREVLEWLTRSST
jgi:phospholipase/carboxylesterase